MNYREVQELKKGETGERVNLKEGWKWVLTKMPYEDFVALTTLHFHGTVAGHYRYCVDEKHDSKKRREDYIKYALYKLIQNLDVSDTHLV